MSRELNIICSHCNKPISDREGQGHGPGYLWIRKDAVFARQDAMEAWMARYSMSNGDGSRTVSVDEEGAASYPVRARWLANHVDCDADEFDDLYHIPVSKLRTWADLVLWTAHLAEKTWIQDTNWFQLLRAVSASESRMIVPVVKPELHAL